MTHSIASHRPALQRIEAADAWPIRHRFESSAGPAPCLRFSHLLWRKLSQFRHHSEVLSRLEPLFDFEDRLYQPSSEMPRKNRKILPRFAAAGRAAPPDCAALRAAAKRGN